MFFYVYVCVYIYITSTYSIRIHAYTCIWYIYTCLSMASMKAMLKTSTAAMVKEL